MVVSETPPLLKGHQEAAMKPAPAFLHRSTLLEDAGGGAVCTINAVGV